MCKTRVKKCQFNIVGYKLSWFNQLVVHQANKKGYSFDYIIQTISFLTFSNVKTYFCNDRLLTGLMKQVLRHLSIKNSHGETIMDE